MKSGSSLLTTGQIAKLSHVHINVVKKWISEGLLTAYRLPAGHFRIEKSHYLQFLKTTGMPLPEELRDITTPAILAIDDDVAQLELLTDYLSSIGFLVETATDGHLGLIQVGALQPDLILLDINMPKVNGFDVLNALHKQLERPEIIIMTGEYDADLLERLKSYDIRHILHKPFSLADLGETVGFLQAEFA